ncbi:MAG: hypothetical protein A2019_06780 [Sulfurimonas sp. GWF2_37_8]|nr:MAG: hypothetical protein A2019_06780 [Sulfurimonas sp. GWF2_37_8]
MKKNTNNKPQIFIFSKIFTNILYCIFLTLFLNQSAYAIDNSQKVLLLRDEAEQAFRKGIEMKDDEKAEPFFSTAKTKYEEILKNLNTPNGYVYYNIGNCYFMMKQYGYAIVNYHRAKKYIPGERNIELNLSAAQKNVETSIKRKQINEVMHLVFFWHYFMNLRNRILIFIIAVNVFFICASIKLFTEWKITGIAMKIATIVLICFGISIAFQYYDDTYTPRGVIVKDSIIARKGNSSSYEQSFDKPLNEGVEFKVIEIKEEWYRILLDNGVECWIPAESAELV